MAEDIHNPLNNPEYDGYDDVGAPDDSDPGLTDFLGDIFGDNPEESEPAPEVEAPEQPARPVAAEAEAAPEPEEAHGAPATSQAEPDDDTDFRRQQRELLDRANRHFDRLEHPPEQPAQAPAALTPDAIYQQYEPHLQKFAEQGWFEEDFVALYPKQAALLAHMWTVGSELQQRSQQTSQFVETNERQRAINEANQQIDSAIDAVAGRGEIFDALKDDEIRSGFREFLVNDLNPKLSQVTPDFLARQFYAYNQDAILETMKLAASPDGQAPAASMTEQETSSGRPAPRTQNKPEFVALLEGLPAERWY